MRKQLIVLAALGLMLGAVPPRAVAGDAPAWSFDPPHCSVMFFVRHIFADVPGRFAVYDGVVRFDPDNLAGSVVDVKVDMASVDTGVAKRDEHLRSPDFFDAAKYPSMRFVSREIVQTGPGRYAARGELTIKDATRPVDIPFEYLGAASSPMEKGKTVAGFRARFAINMLEYGVSDGRFQKMGVLGDRVDILLNLEMLR